MISLSLSLSFVFFSFLLPSLMCIAIPCSLYSSMFDFFSPKEKKKKKKTRLLLFTSPWFPRDLFLCLLPLPSFFYFFSLFQFLKLFFFISFLLLLSFILYLSFPHTKMTAPAPKFNFKVVLLGEGSSSSSLFCLHHERKKERRRRSKKNKEKNREE